MFESTVSWGSGANPDGNYELVVADPDGTDAEQLTETTSPIGPGIPDLTPDGATALPEAPPSTIADGSETVYLGAWDSQVCSRLRQIYSADAGSVAPLTPDTCDVNLAPVVSASGGAVVFKSTGSYSGVGGPSLLKVPLGGGTIEPLIDDGGDPDAPRIDGTGTWIASSSETDADGMTPSGLGQIFRARVDGSSVERLTSASDGTSSLPDISADGSRVVISTRTDARGLNPDGGWDLWLADFAAAGRIEPSVASPTTVDWPADPRSVSWDVIRGSLAALAIDGVDVDLGPVISRDEGSLDTEASWGDGTGDLRRVPAVGDCAL